MGDEGRSILSVLSVRSIFFSGYLRNDLSAFFYPHFVARTDVQLTDEIFVMQGGSLNDSATQLNGFQIRDRRNNARSTYLKRYLFE